MRTKLLAIALCAAGLFAGSAITANAKDISITLVDQAQQATHNLPAVFDQCIAGVTLRNDATTCKAVGQFLADLSNVVTTVQAKAAEADKAEADKAKDATPAPKKK
jgi:hypothetical protein